MDSKEDPRINELNRLKRIIVGAVTVGCSSLLLIIFISVTTQLSVQRIHSVLEEELRYCNGGNDKIDDYVHSAYQIMGVQRRKRDAGSTMATAKTSNETVVVKNETVVAKNETVVAKNETVVVSKNETE